MNDRYFLKIHKGGYFAKPRRLGVPLRVEYSRRGEMLINALRSIFRIFQQRVNLKKLVFILNSEAVKTAVDLNVAFKPLFSFK